MAFQADDEIDPALLAIALRGGRGGGLLGKSSGSSLLSPGPTPQMAWSQTLQSSPFYQGVPSQSGAFGQIAQAILPVILADAASKQAGEAEKNRQIFLKAHLAQAEMEVQKAQQEMLAEAFALALMDDPAKQAEKAANLPEGSSLSVKARGQELTLKRPESAAPFPTLAEQAQTAQAMGLGELSLSVDSKGRPKLSATRVRPDGIGAGLGSLGKGLSDFAKAAAMNGASSQQTAELVRRRAALDAGGYMDLSDGQVKPLPTEKMNEEALNVRKNTAVAVRDIDELASMIQESPYAAGGLTASIASIVQGTADQAAGIGIGPLARYVDRKKGTILSELPSADLSPELKKKIQNNLAPTGPLGSMWERYDPNVARINTLKTGLAYTLAKADDPQGRVTDADFENYFNMLSGGSPLLGPNLVGGMGATEALKTLKERAIRRSAEAESTIKQRMDAARWASGEDLNLPSPLGAQIKSVTPQAKEPPPPKPIEALTAEAAQLGPTLVNPSRHTLEEAKNILEKDFLNRIKAAGGKPNLAEITLPVARALIAAGYTE